MLRTIALLSGGLLAATLAGTSAPAAEAQPSACAPGLVAIEVGSSAPGSDDRSLGYVCQAPGAPTWTSFLGLPQDDAAQAVVGPTDGR